MPSHHWVTSAVGFRNRVRPAQTLSLNPQQPNSQWFAPGTVQVARRERELQCLGFWGSWIRNPWMITKVSYSFIFGYFWRMQSSSATDSRRLSIWCATSLQHLGRQGRRVEEARGNKDHMPTAAAPSNAKHHRICTTWPRQDHLC